MGIFSSLFGKKNSNVNSNESNASTTASQNVSVKTTPVLHLKGIPDEKGLYPSELVMLAVAEKFIVSETNFPAYLNYEYEIPNPSKMLMNLQSRGFVKVGSAKDTLDYFKLTELKDIASLLGINAKGKKADIISQISEFDEEALAQFVKERKWKLTDTGLEALKDNPYIQFFLEKHSYNVTEVGIDIWTVNKEYVKNPKYPYRDLIYRGKPVSHGLTSVIFFEGIVKSCFVSVSFCKFAIHLHIKTYYLCTVKTFIIVKNET